MTGHDEVIEEIRESRRRLSAECGHDPARYIERLKAFNRKYGAQVVRFQQQHATPGRESERTS
jgi:hypothetical protein